MSHSFQVFATEIRAARWKPRACCTAGWDLCSLDTAASIPGNLEKDWLDCQQVGAQDGSKLTARPLLY